MIIRMPTIKDKDEEGAGTMHDLHRLVEDTNQAVYALTQQVQALLHHAEDAGRLASTDPLTRMRNRRGLDEAILHQEAQLAQTRQYARRRRAVRPPAPHPPAARVDSNGSTPLYHNGYCLPVDTVTIDQSFIREIVDEPSTRVIVQAIVILAHERGMDVTAEGIETAVQLDHVRALARDRCQGYSFARPLLPAAMGQMVGVSLSSGHRTLCG